MSTGTEEGTEEPITAESTKTGTKERTVMSERKKEEKEPIYKIPKFSVKHTTRLSDNDFSYLPHEANEIFPHKVERITQAQERIKPVMNASLNTNSTPLIPLHL